ncbi:MAG: MobC family plasmid mobilization relaxosome protein [Alphaproteobacteria bacterium]|nr:MobC family plasmid mobilization relaxosome protein [Alphaproteobacteria bacterium]
MPRRGYRKGISDQREPVSRSVRTHITEDEFAALKVEATDRAMTMSKLLRRLITAHLRQQATELPHRRGPSTTAIRELARTGNLLNQLARQANTGLVQVSETEIRRALDQVLTAIERF